MSLQENCIQIKMITERNRAAIGSSLNTVLKQADDGGGMQ